MSDSNEGRFWLIVTDPGCVPQRKGPWANGQTKAILREFMRERPTALIHLLTVDENGVPDVSHGPEVLQILDGRSMSFASKHNKRETEAAQAAATIAERRMEEMREALEECRLIVANLPHGEDLLLAKIDAALRPSGGV